MNSARQSCIYNLDTTGRGGGNLTSRAYGVQTLGIQLKQSRCLNRCEEESDWNFRTVPALIYFVTKDFALQLTHF